MDGNSHMEVLLRCVYLGTSDDGRPRGTDPWPRGTDPWPKLQLEGPGKGLPFGMELCTGVLTAYSI